MIHFKNILLATALLAAVLPASAQKHSISSLTDTKATVKAMETIIAKNDGHYVEPIIAEICAKKKNNPELCVGAADAFWYKTGIRDSTNAFKYIKKAIAANKNYVPAYILTAEIWNDCQDTLKAIEWYNKAIQADTLYAKTYRALAKMREKSGNYDEAYRIYKRAKAAIPTFPANLEIARMYYKTDTYSGYNKAIEHFKIAEVDSMEAYDYNSYANLYNLVASQAQDRGAKVANYLKMLEISEEGIQRFPKDFYVLEVGLVAAVQIHDKLGQSEAEKKREYAEKAENYGERAIAEGDTLVNDVIYKFYGIALKNRHKYDKAIKVFERVLNSDKAEEADKDIVMKHITDSYKELGEYDKAEELFKKNLEKKENKGTAGIKDYDNMVKFYKEQAEELNGKDKIDVLWKADAMYSRSAEKDLQNAGYAYYYQIFLRHEIDQYTNGEDNTRGLALEPARKLYALMLTKGTLEGSNKEFMVQACNYLASYYQFTKKSPKEAKQYWLKLYETDPTNKNAILVLTKLYKMKL